MNNVFTNKTDNNEIVIRISKCNNISQIDDLESYGFQIHDEVENVLFCSYKLENE